MGAYSFFFVKEYSGIGAGLKKIRERVELTRWILMSVQKRFQRLSNTTNPALRAS